MGERKTTKELELDAEGNPTGKITWKFSDETTETFDLATCNEQIRARLALHGASQKIGDSYAGAAGETDPLEFAKAAVRGTIAQLYAGDWRVSGTGAGPRVNDLAVAIARATGESIEDSIELVSAMTDDDKKTWRAKTKIKLELAKLQGERQAARIQALAEAAAKEDAAAASPSA